MSPTTAWILAIAIWFVVMIAMALIAMHAVGV